MSLKQRLALAGGSAMTGASDMVDNEIISGAMEVAGENENVCGQIFKCDLSLLGGELPISPFPTPIHCIANSCQGIDYF